VIDYPDHLAVVDNKEIRLTHQQLWDLSGELAKMLQQSGIEIGDRVIMLLPNWASWQVVFLALLRVQAVPAPIPVTTDIKTLGYAIELTQSVLVIVGASDFDRNLRQLAIAAVDLCSESPAVLAVSREGDFVWEPKPFLPKKSSVKIPMLDQVMFTSSTTGKPKAVMHSSDSLGALNQTFSDRFSLHKGKSIFMASPLGHSVGAYHGARLALFTGAPLVIMDRWEPAEAIDLINSYGCAFTAAATPFLKDLIDLAMLQGDPKLLSMETFLCGGAPVPPILLNQALQWLPKTFVTNLWGMTEGGLVTCKLDCPTKKLVSRAGVGLPGLELQIRSTNGEILQSEEEGELLMRGPGVFFGYMGQDELYNSLITEDLFFKTEDLGLLDKDGYLQITGRLKDLIIRGGVNVSPIPIEDAISKHPDIKNVAVVGYPDDRLGERICAVVLPYERKPSLEELIDFVTSEGIPTRSCPEMVRFVNRMPMTAGGKVRKADLRAAFGSHPS